MMRFFILMLLCSALLQAQEHAIEADHPDVEKKKKEGIIIFPIGFFTPETSVGGGITTVLFKEHFKTAEELRSDSLTAVAFYTYRNQFFLAMIGNKYYNEASFHYKPVFALSQFPKKFYGTGNTGNITEDAIVPFSIKLDQTFEYRIFEKLYAGFVLVQGYYHLGAVPSGGVAEQYSAHHRTNGFFSGTGVALARDSRDNSLYPTRGATSRVAAIFFSNIFGSAFTFTRYNLDHAGYFSLPLNIILAYQLYGDAVTGEPPLSFIPELGGQNLMRGFYQGKYADKLYLAGQTELRFPLFWRLGGVLFGAAGNVYPGIKDIADSPLRVSGGFGLRIALKKEQNINFRIDFGFANDKKFFNFYFNVLEAF